MNIEGLLPYFAPLMVLGLLYLRTRKPYRVRPLALLIVPLVMTLLVAGTVLFQPHEPFVPLAYAGFVACILAGVATGLIRARSIRMWIDRANGQLMAEASGLALLLIGGLFILRTMVRQVIDPGSQNAAVIDALLLFALAMIVSQRMMMWQRYRRIVTADAAAA